jgi:hypothetical protein
VFHTRWEIVSLSLLVIVDTLPGAVRGSAGGSGRGRLEQATGDGRLRPVAPGLHVGDSGPSSLGVIYVMRALDSVAFVFFQPAKSAAIPLIVSRKTKAKQPRARRSQPDPNRRAGSWSHSAEAVWIDLEPAGRRRVISGERSDDGEGDHEAG